MVVISDTELVDIINNNFSIAEYMKKEGWESASFENKIHLSW